MFVMMVASTKNYDFFSFFLYVGRDWFVLIKQTRKNPHTVEQALFDAKKCQYMF